MYGPGTRYNDYRRQYASYQYGGGNDGRNSNYNNADQIRCVFLIYENFEDDIWNQLIGFFQQKPNVDNYRPLWRNRSCKMIGINAISNAFILNTNLPGNKTNNNLEKIDLIRFFSLFYENFPLQKTLN